MDKVTIAIVGGIILIATFVPSTSSSHVCKSGEFRCQRGKKCILNEKICDGIQDCPKSGEDESAEFCANLFNHTCSSSDDFVCGFGGCIPALKKCNGVFDCYDGSDENEDTCNNYTCSSTEFRCSYGACIPSDKSCDGKTHCADHSDEKSDQCTSMQCKPGQFRCKYGGCINARKLCNGRRDCHDKSDENGRMCRHIKRQAQQALLRQRPGLNGTAGGSCDPVCPALRRLPPGVQAECVDPQTHKVIKCSSRYIPIGTVARFHCKKHYIYLGAAGEVSDRVCQSDGTWSGRKGHYRCHVECGKRSDPAASLPELKEKSNPGEEFLREWPWFVGISIPTDGEAFTKCAGTLISTKSVLTNAQCLHEYNSNTSTYDLVNPRKIHVYVNRAQREGLQQDDGFVQIKRVKRIKLHPDFVMNITNAQSRHSDLAILKLRRHVQLSDTVKPVCIPTFSAGLLNELQLKEGQNGIALGWDYKTSNETIAREFNFTVSNKSLCSDTFNRSEPLELPPKSLCGTYQDAFTETDHCLGSRGGGLFFPSGNSSEDQRWVLQGVFSHEVFNLDVLPCKRTQGFALVSEYSDWIKDYVKKVQKL